MKNSRSPRRSHPAKRKSGALLEGPIPLFWMTTRECFLTKAALWLALGHFHFPILSCGEGWGTHSDAQI
jgi:hypothetical protein